MTFQTHASVGDMILGEAADVEAVVWAPDDADVDVDLAGLGDGEVADAWGHESELRAAARERQVAEHDEAERVAILNETRAQTQEREIAGLRSEAEKRKREEVAEARRLLRERNAMDEMARLAGSDAEAADRIRDARAVQLAAERELASHVGVDELEAAIRAMDGLDGPESSDPESTPKISTAITTAAQLESLLIATAAAGATSDRIGVSFDASPETDHRLQSENEPDEMHEATLADTTETAAQMGDESGTDSLEAEATMDGAEPEMEPDLSAALTAAMELDMDSALAQDSNNNEAGFSFDDADPAPAVYADSSSGAVVADPEVSAEQTNTVISADEYTVAHDEPVSVVFDDAETSLDVEFAFDAVDAAEPNVPVYAEAVALIIDEPEASADELPGVAIDEYAVAYDEPAFVVFDDAETNLDVEFAVGAAEPNVPVYAEAADVLIIDEPEIIVDAVTYDEPVIFVAEPDEPSIDTGAEIATVAEYMDVPAPAQEAAPEVHIHHHYAAEPVAPQIIYATAPAQASAGDPDSSHAHAAPYESQPMTSARPQAQPARESRAQARAARTETRNEYVNAPTPVEDEQPFVELAPLAPVQKIKEPLFVWRGKPIGGTKLTAAEQVASQRAKLDTRPAAQAAVVARPARNSVITRQYRSSGVDTQSWFDDSIQECLRLGVSDLHVGVESDGENGDRLTARIRIDGQLRAFQTIEGADARTIINRFKTNAGLATDGSFVPEEAVYDVVVDGETRKARVALFRTAKGGDAMVLRLPPTGSLRSLAELEFSAQNLDLFHDLLRSANRMILMAGPMGSGKTTTVHGALMEIATPERSVWSIEDPVERHIAGLIQLEVDEENGAGFDALLPVLVRSDYDTLFLGEIRDRATASAGVRQAKAGRQVLTTIHATDNVMALKRLIELSGETPMSVLDSVLGVVSQRLVRRLNPEWNGWEPATKYRGRVPIHEVLRLNDELIEALSQDTSISEQKRVAAEASESTFALDAKRLVVAGITDWDEINRVLGS